VRPQGGTQKCKTAVFCLKLHFTWRKSATKFPCVNTVSDKVVRHLLAYLSVQKWFAGNVPYYVKFGRNWPIPFKRSYLHSSGHNTGVWRNDRRANGQKWSSNSVHWLVRCTLKMKTKLSQVYNDVDLLEQRRRCKMFFHLFFTFLTF